MKTKTNFATTSDVRNLINATMETFPKGPERDGIQTKMFNYWDNFNAGNNLPEGSDRKRFVAEALDNANAALRIARTLVNKGQQFSGAYVKVTDLISKLSKIKVGKNEMAKVEDKFYGKRVVKGIFAKAKFESRNDYIDAILNLSTLVSNAESLITNKKIDAAKKVLKQAQAIVDSNPNHKELDSQGMVQFLNELKRKVGMSRIGVKAKFATKPTRKFKGGDRVAVLSDGKVVAKGIIDYLFDYDNYVGTYIYKVRQDDGRRASYNETSLKKMSRTGSKAKFANGGTKTASFLAKIDSKSKAMILENIAKNYGISAQAALAEVTDSEAENLLDYMTEPARSAASVLMQKYGSFSRTGAKVFK